MAKRKYKLKRKFKLVLLFLIVLVVGVLLFQNNSVSVIEQTIEKIENITLSKVDFFNTDKLYMPLGSTITFEFDDIEVVI